MLIIVLRMRIMVIMMRMMMMTVVILVMMMMMTVVILVMMIMMMIDVCRSDSKLFFTGGAQSTPCTRNVDYLPDTS